jgi:hypothetical protein
MSTQLPEGQLLIPNARLGYPKLFKAEGIKNDADSKPRYGCQIYLSKSDEATKAKIDKEIARLSKLHFKGVKPKTKDLSVQDGDVDGDENTKGCWVISANRAESQGRPQVVDRSRKPIDSSESAEVYAGCVCNFLISFFVPKNWSKICTSLEVVQRVKDGERIGAARVAAEDVMPDLGESDEDSEYEA